jgi:hypothetical protein
MDATYSNSGGFSWKGFFFFAYIALIIIQLSLHALNHGGAGDRVRDCVFRGKVIQVWQNDYDKNRFYLICGLEEGRFGIYVIERCGKIYHEVSAFVKDKFTRIEQIAQYMQNGGNFPSVLPLLPCLLGIIIFGGIIGGVATKL